MSAPRRLRHYLRSTTLSRPASPRYSSRTFTSSRPRCAEQRKQPASPHASFYSDIVPGMIPVALLGSAVYMGLQLLQSHLSHEKYTDEARIRIDQLEAEVDTLRAARSLSPSVKGEAISSRQGASALPSPTAWFRRFW